MTGCASTCTPPGPGIVIGRRGAEADRLRDAAGQDHRQPEDPAQHPGDQAARARRGADRAGHRRPAGRPGQLPPGHEAGDPDGAEGRRAGRPGAVLRPPRRLRDGPQGVLPRRPGAAAHPARRHRLRLPRGQDHLRPHRREGLDLQGRHPAVQDLGRGQDRREAAMAVGETSGQSRPRRVVSAGGGRRRPELGEPGTAPRPRPRRRRRDRRRRPTIAAVDEDRPIVESIPSSSACSPRKRRSSAAPRRAPRDAALPRRTC